MQPAINEKITDRARRVRVAIGLAFLLISLAYLIQMASPLRLVDDGVDYLLQASSALDGNGFRVHGEVSMRPAGYPALIFLLVKAGIGKSWAIVGLNCLLLGVGIWASYAVLRASFALDVASAQFICLLSLLSFVMVKHVTLPLSDVSFFGASMPCLLLLRQAQVMPSPRRYWRLAVAAPLMIFCIELRTIGIALIPAFAWAASGGIPGLKKILQWAQRRKIAALAILLLGLLLTAWGGRMLLHSRYLQFNAKTILKRSVVHNIVSDLKDHTLEWGELTINAPASKFPRSLALPIRGIGFIMWLLCFTAIWGNRRTLDSTGVYLLAFIPIVLENPWSDARFWLPVLPLLIGYVLLGARRIISAQWLRPAIFAYCSLFCLLGVAALGYSTRLTFAGSRFPDLYGDGSLRATYRLAFLGESSRNPDAVSQDALYLLHRYDWRLSVEKR